MADFPEPRPYAAHRAQTDQALGGMACWAGDPLETRQIAPPVRPARWQVMLGAVVFVGALVGLAWKVTP